MGNQRGQLALILTSENGHLSVAYLNDRRETIQCIKDQPFSNLSYPGFFGISARNTIDRENVIDMHVKSIKVTNFDPTKYKRNEDKMTTSEAIEAGNEIDMLRDALGFTNEQFLEQLVGADSSVLFTDELRGEAADILKQYADQMKDIDRYLRDNLGNIAADDDRPEVFYKMLEHVKHITHSLQRLNEEEERFSKSVKQFEK